jgi:hypothetical protein
VLLACGGLGDLEEVVLAGARVVACVVFGGYMGGLSGWDVGGSFVFFFSSNKTGSTNWRSRFLGFGHALQDKNKKRLT